MEYYYDTLSKTEYIDHGYDSWWNYRKELTNFICDSTFAVDSKKDAIIYGAGAMYDLDIKKLLGTFNRITLVDYNLDVVRAGLKRVGMQGDGHIRLVDMELFPIEDENYRLLEDMLIAKAPIDEVKEFFEDIGVFASNQGFALRGVVKTLDKQWQDIYDRHYDVAICIGLHSQLTIRLTALVNRYKNSYSNCDRTVLDSLLMDITFKAVKTFNNMLINKECVDEIYLGYEYSSFSKDDYNFSKIDYVKHCFSTGHSEIVDNMKLIRVRGAYECEQDITKRVHDKKVSIEGMNYLIWPFSEDKEYLMVNYILST